MSKVKKKAVSKGYVEPFTMLGTETKVVQPSKATDPKAKEANAWTIMVYMAGDNNLGEEMVYALTSMEFVGSRPSDYEVFALYDAGIGPVTLRIRDRHAPAVNLLEQAETAQNKDLADSVADKARELKAAEQRATTLNAEAQDLAAQNRDLAANLHNVVCTGILQTKPGTKSNGGPRIGLDLTKDLQSQVLAGLRKDAEHENAERERLEREEDLRSAEVNRKALAAFKAAATDKEAMAALEQLEPSALGPVETTLTEFVIRTIKEHPATQYLLVLSGHGSGAVEDFLSGNKRFDGLTIPELRESLAAVRGYFADKTFVNANGENQPYLLHGKIDILGLDSCLMGMAEVAYEVRQSVDFLVGAEGFEPNTGWPYDRVLRVLQQRPDPETLARNIVTEYIGFYSDYTLAEASTDLSALDLRDGGVNEQSKIKRFADTLGCRNAQGKRMGLAPLLTDLLKDPATRDATKDNLVLAHWEAQGFKFEQHVDVYDFCDLLQKRYQAQHPVWNACQEVKAAIEDLVIASAYCGPKFQYSRGVSIFFPWANITDAAGVRELDHYQSLEFAETLWDEFAKTYHLYTQRDARTGRGERQLSTLNRREDLFTGKPGKFGTAASAKFGTAASAKFGTAASAKFGTAASAKFGTAASAKFGTAASAKFGTAASAKFSGAGSFEVFKIASMKNPPIIWFNE